MSKKTKSLNIWNKHGNEYHPGSIAAQTKVLEPGIYSYNANLAGWWLSCEQEKFVFPYKIYGTHDAIINRVTKSWESLPTNLGILLNGIKGTGKTIVAQLISNWAISKGIPVLIVRDPIPLETVLSSINQDIVVLLDEFEKTYSNPNSTPTDVGGDIKSQQAILSVLDGTSKSLNKRLFILTTNTKRVDPNFIDRPSRIRYVWEFGRMNDNIIDELVNDLLKPELKHLKSDIGVYLSRRETLSFDAVKQVVNECNTFNESPESFESFMNLAEDAPAGYIIELHPDDGPTKELSRYFKPHDEALFSKLLTKAGKQYFIDKFSSLRRSVQFNSHSFFLDVQGPVEDEDSTYWCYVGFPIRGFDTWLNEKVASRMYSHTLWWDGTHPNFKQPDWAKKITRGEALTEEEENQVENFTEKETLHGFDKKLVKVKFSKNNEKFVYRPGMF